MNITKEHIKTIAIYTARILVTNDPNIGSFNSLQLTNLCTKQILAKACNSASIGIIIDTDAYNHIKNDRYFHASLKMNVDILLQNKKLY